MDWKCISIALFSKSRLSVLAPYLDHACWVQSSSQQRNLIIACRFWLRVFCLKDTNRKGNTTVVGLGSSFFRLFPSSFSLSSPSTLKIRSCRHNLSSATAIIFSKTFFFGLRSLFLAFTPGDSLLRLSHFTFFSPPKLVDCRLLVSLILLVALPVPLSYPFLESAPKGPMSCRSQGGGAALLSLNWLVYV